MADKNKKLRDLIRRVLIQEFKMDVKHQKSFDVDALMQRIKNEHPSVETASLEEAQQEIKKAFQSHHNPDRK